MEPDRWGRVVEALFIVTAAGRAPLGAATMREAERQAAYEVFCGFGPATIARGGKVLATVLRDSVGRTVIDFGAPTPKLL